VKVEEASVRRRIFADIDERRREGLGHFRDSTEIIRLASLPAALGGMPGVRVSSKGGHVDHVFLPSGSKECEAMYLIDGFPAESAEVGELTPDKVVAIEVFERASSIPSSIGSKLRRRPTCGVAVFWTHRFAP